MTATIVGTASLRPGQSVATAAVVERAYPDRDAEEIRAKTGIDTRYFADPADTHAQLGAQCLTAALERARMPASELSRLFFVCSTGADVAIPATANLVLRHLGLGRTIDGFDVNNACMGFLSGMDLAWRSVATGSGPVAVLTVELLSRHIAPDSPRSYVVLGDAVGCAIVAPGTGRFVATHLANDPRYFGSVQLDHAALTGKPERIVFGSSNRQITAEAVGAVQLSTQRVLDEAALTMADVDWVLVHQPNGAMLDRILGALDVDRSKTVPLAAEIGSVGAASIPVSLDRLLRTRDVQPGHRILMVGVGGGMAYGAMLYEVGRPDDG